MKERLVLLSTTTEDETTARRIAKELVEKRLAACAQVVDSMTSYYWWNEEVQESMELLILVKTKEKHIVDIESLFREIHPYDVPELAAVPLSGGSSEYLKWIEENC